MKPKQRQRRLEGRIRDYALMMESKAHETKVKLRMEAGGYHKPGSNNK